LVLAQGSTRRLHAVLEQHEQDDAAENGDPDYPRTWRHLELASFPGVLVTAVFIIIRHLKPAAASLARSVNTRNLSH